MPVTQNKKLYFLHSNFQVTFVLFYLFLYCLYCCCHLWLPFILYVCWKHISLVEESEINIRVLWKADFIRWCPNKKQDNTSEISSVCNILDSLLYQIINLHLS